MALNIKNPEADRLVRELARRRKQPLTDVLIDVLRAELAREKQRTRPPGLADKLLSIGAAYSSLPTLEQGTDAEILGYDAMGT